MGRTVLTSVTVRRSQRALLKSVYWCFPQLKKWSTFGSLEVTSETEMDKALHSVVTEEDCEILKIPAKEYEKLKLVRGAHLKLLLKLDLIIESINWIYLTNNTFVQVPGMKARFSVNVYDENSLAFYEFQNYPFTQLANR